MSRISLAVAIGISAIGSLPLSSLVQAAEIKVLASVALTAALNELAPQYERTTGNKLSLGYSLVADIRKRVLDGEIADVIILSRPVMESESPRLRPIAPARLLPGTPRQLAFPDALRSTRTVRIQIFQKLFAVALPTAISNGSIASVRRINASCVSLRRSRFGNVSSQAI
jgi:hypothetical protein